MVIVGVGARVGAPEGIGKQEARKNENGTRMSKQKKVRMKESRTMSEGGRQREIEVDSGRQREIEGDRGRQREIEGDRGRQREIEGDRGRQREIEGDSGRQREIQGDRGRQREIAGDCKLVSSERRGVLYKCSVIICCRRRRYQSSDS